MPFRLIILLSQLFFLSGCFFHSSDSSEWESYSRFLRNAERHLRAKDYPKAITAYENHINKRLEEKNKPEWENPYFYHLLIGDLHLKRKDTKAALKSYRFAHEKKVDSGLVSDRYRLVANWLANRGRYKEAIKILNSNRETDPLLFDMIRDRIAREMVLAEEGTLTLPIK